MAVTHQSLIKHRLRCAKPSYIGFLFNAFHLIRSSFNRHNSRSFQQPACQHKHHNCMDIKFDEALLIEGMIFSEKGRGAPFLRKNHPWILQPLR
jgi:hypothetical protein